MLININWAQPAAMIASTVLHDTTVWEFVYQVVKDVLLVYMNCDESLELGSFNPRQVLCRDVDQLVQDVEEFLVRGGHQAFVKACILQRHFWLRGPYHLKTEQANLNTSSCSCIPIIERKRK